MDVRNSASCPRLALAVLLLASSLSSTAATVYRYEGNVFDQFEAPYGPTDFITAAITLDAPVDITTVVDLQDFAGFGLEMAVGGRTITGADTTILRSTFEFAPDGSIFTWFLGISDDQDGTSFSTLHLPRDNNSKDLVAVDFALVAGNERMQGVWSCHGDCLTPPVSPVPVPPALALLVSALAVVARRRRLASSGN